MIFLAATLFLGSCFPLVTPFLCIWVDPPTRLVTNGCLASDELAGCVCAIGNDLAAYVDVLGDDLVSCVDGLVAKVVVADWLTSGFWYVL